MPRPKPTTVLTAEDIEALWANAAQPDDYPALRQHQILQDGEPAQLPEDVVEEARRAAEQLAGPRRRRTRSSSPSRVKAYEASAEAIEELMEALDIPHEAYDIEDRQVVMHVTDEEVADYPLVPEGYGFKGGVARKALARALRLPISTGAVRDIDLLRAPDVSGEQDRELAERYMTEDLILGDAKVEALTTPHEYFVTREVTINQNLFLDGEVRITHLGLLDTLGGVIRVTRGHMKQNFGRVHPIVAFKVLRFSANMEVEGRKPVIPPFRVNFRRRPHPFAFFFALQLSRAFEYGPEVAERYVEYARRWNLLGKAELDDRVTAREAADLLTERLTDYNLNFDG